MKKRIALLLVLIFALNISCALGGGDPVDDNTANPSAKPGSADPGVYHSITVNDGCAYEWGTETRITKASKGGKIMVRMQKDKCPDGQYVGGLNRAPSSLAIEKNHSDWLFVMPDEDVVISPVYKPQVAGVLDLRYGPFPLNSEDAYEMQTVLEDSFGPTDHFDLDKDGNDDIFIAANEIGIYSFCSIPISITLRVPKAVKYNPLVIRFGDPTVSFNPNGGTDNMDPVKILDLNFKYILPYCTITSPEGKLFDTWDKGAPGTEITVAEDTVITALWKDTNTPTVGSLKYRISGSKAIVTGPKDKNVKKLIIPSTILVNGKFYKVAEIKAGAFDGMKKLTAVTIGVNVKTIGKCAFRNCRKLKTITIKTKKLTDSSVKSDAFKGIYKKATFKCPDGFRDAYKKILLKKGAPKTCKFR